MRLMISVVMLCALVRVAAAQDKQNAAGDAIDPWTSVSIKLGDPPSAETLADARKTNGADCDKVAKQLAAKGGDALLWDGYGDPDAKQLGKVWSIPAVKLGWFCDKWRQDLVLYGLRNIAVEAKTASQIVANGLGDEDKKNIRSGGDDFRKAAKSCHADADALTKYGASPDLEIKDQEGTTVAKLSEMPDLCEKLNGEADLYDKEWETASKQFEKPFTDAGVTGDKLTWLVYYGPGIDGWEVKGCKDATSIGQLKKANAWFQWFTDDAGIITVRKWTWKGDKLAKQTEKQFLTEKKAYKGGCK